MAIRSHNKKGAPQRDAFFISPEKIKRITEPEQQPVLLVRQEQMAQQGLPEQQARRG